MKPALPHHRRLDPRFHDVDLRDQAFDTCIEVRENCSGSVRIFLINLSSGTLGFDERLTGQHRGSVEFARHASP